MDTPNLPAATWRKSNYSDHNGACVEVAVAGTLVGVRDSKHTQAGHLALSTVGWNGLVATIKSDKLVQ